MTFTATATKAISALAALLLLTGPGARAQQPSQEQIAAIRASCRSDFMANCSGVTPGGKDALECLKRNLAKLSGSCQTAVSAITPAPPAAPAPQRRSRRRLPPAAAAPPAHSSCRPAAAPRPTPPAGGQAATPLAAPPPPQPRRQRLLRPRRHQPLHRTATRCDGRCCRARRCASSRRSAQADAASALRRRAAGGGPPIARLLRAQGRRTCRRCCKSASPR